MPEPEPEPAQPSYIVPASYEFNGINYTSSAQRVNMLKELVAYLRLTHTATANVSISASKLSEHAAKL